MKPADAILDKHNIRAAIPVEVAHLYIPVRAA